MKRTLTCTRTLTALAAAGAMLLAAAGPVSSAEDSGAGNNLSYPALWSEPGYQLTLRGTMDAPVIDGVVLPGTYSTDDLTPCLGAVQDDALNTWQADNATTPSAPVAFVDWGDKLEARDAGAQQKAIRVETSLYAAADPQLTRYEMCYVSGQGPDEVWGLRVTEVPGDPVTYAPVTTESSDAMVYTAGARLTIQRVVPGRTYAWDGSAHRWTGSGVDDPVFNAAVHEKTADGPGTYGAEVTVSGKITYGYNWMTSGLPQGEYRLTFSLDGPAGSFPGSGTNLATAQLLVSEEAAAVPAEGDGEDGGGTGGGEGMGNTAVIVGALDLTYIDVGVGTRTDPVPPLDEGVTPPSGGSSDGAANSATGSPAAPQSVAPASGPEQAAAPQPATSRAAQTARLRAPASGRYPVGTVIVLSRAAVRTSAGVTVRWRATTQSRAVCTVRTVKGRATATLNRAGTCRAVAWAPAPSPDYLPFRVQRTYRAVP